MKDKTTAEIHLEVAKAKVEMLRFVRNGRVLDFKLFKALIEKPDAVKRVIEVLEETGHVFCNKPEVPSVVTEQADKLSQPTVELETEQDTDSAEDSPLYPQHQMLTKPQPSPKECLSILTVAKPDLMKSIGMLMNGMALKKEEQLNVLYYLEALLMLKHLQRSVVVKNMTVDDWCTRCKVSNDHGTIYVIGVKGHKTGAQQEATISLDEEEDAWMDIYYKLIRPAFLQGLPEEQAKPDHFFISSTGRPIYSTYNDVRKLQLKSELPHCSEDASSKGVCCDEDYQVTLDGEPPKKKQRSILSIGNEKAYNDKWREIQQNMRINDIIENFPCRRPSLQAVSRYISRQAWKKNPVNAENVCQLWKPAIKATGEIDSETIRQLLTSQKWNGLRIAEDPKKGKKVMTTRTFKKGEVKFKAVIQFVRIFLPVSVVQ
ncbi:hypothetical protein DPEC_G00204730 [Dallia pectoralis]|uniref:Uncharacterized protein n=1 Tax=Dallia pectoralis TaxID=75939 RepID=A0ACC2G4N1_DALPE|nr:hypothetical protein DPEC_G00204730 [Dallia pectoralis]